MKIISKEEIENMFQRLNPKLDESNIIMVEDEGLSNVLKYFLFLQQYTEDIIDHSSFTFEDIFYSQYYWFVMFKNQFFSSFGYDGGMDQQAFLLLEKICNDLEGNVDWDVIEDIEKTLAE